MSGNPFTQPVDERTDDERALERAAILVYLGITEEEVPGLDGV